MDDIDELSNPAILGISVACALMGLVVYGMVRPIPPATMVALAHAVVHEQMAPAAADF